MEVTDLVYNDWPSIPVPAFVQVEGWADYSWHNDVCARSEFELDATGAHLRVWVEHDKPEEREYADSPRFMVAFHPDPDDDANYEELYRGEVEAEAAAAIRMFLEKRR